MKLYSPKIKSFPIFSPKKVLLVFWEMELFSHRIKRPSVGTFRAQKI